MKHKHTSDIIFQYGGITQGEACGKCGSRLSPVRGGATSGK